MAKRAMSDCDIVLRRTEKLDPQAWTQRGLAALHTAEICLHEGSLQSSLDFLDQAHSNFHEVLRLTNSRMADAAVGHDATERAAAAIILATDDQALRARARAITDSPFIRNSV